MRGFWGGTLSMFFAFFAWFSMSPVALDMAHSIDICENQRFPPEEFPNRKAFLSYTSLESEESYCRYGTVSEDGEVVDCADAAEAAEASEQLSKYNAEVLPKCICAPETHCARILLLSGALSILSGTICQMFLSGIIEFFGPVQTQATILVISALGLNAQMGVWDETSLMVASLLVGVAGASIFTSQFWCEQNFSPSVIGRVSGTSDGWGNLGAGAAQIVMIWCVMEPLTHLGLPFDTAWRFALIFPELIVLECSRWITNYCWDTPRGRYRSERTKTPAELRREILRCLADPRVLALGYQYASCFGVELVMNVVLTTHFRTYFQMDLGLACVVGGSFGLMNLFARALGGWISDYLFLAVGYRGRLWFQASVFALEGAAMITFSKIHSQSPWELVMVLLLVFSVLVQMAEGSTFAILPQVFPSRTAAASSVVSILANIGAIIVLLTIYKLFGADDPMFPYEIHALVICPAALLTVFLACPEKQEPKHPGKEPEQATFAFLQKEEESENGPEAPAAVSLEAGDNAS